MDDVFILRPLWIFFFIHIPALRGKLMSIHFMKEEGVLIKDKKEMIETI